MGKLEKKSLKSIYQFRIGYNQLCLALLEIPHRRTYVHYIYSSRECVRNVDLWVQVHLGELRSQNQRVHIVLEVSKSVGGKGDVLKICGFVHPLHPC